METPSYYHLCADGADARNFIVSDLDFVAAFNIIGVCAANCPDVKVVVFSLEDTHPHFLLYGSYTVCLKFKQMFENTYRKYVINSRGSTEGMLLDIQMYSVGSYDYLKNVGTYIVNQATKDGKRVMPYDYLFGTGSMYFRPRQLKPIWCFDNAWDYVPPVRIDSMSIHERAAVLHSKKEVPGEWLISNGYLLPQNYVDVDRFESIYVTHNCFRTFLSSGRSREAEVSEKMAQVRGVAMEDLEARNYCRALSMELFSSRDVRRLDAHQRLSLAMELRKRYRLSFRQIAILSRLPLQEVEKYLR